MDADNYLLQVVTYIQTNPLRAGLTGMAGVAIGDTCQGLGNVIVLSLLSKNKADRVGGRYRRFMAIQDEEEIRKVCEGEKWSSVERMKALITRDRPMRQMVEKIILLLSKS